MHVQNKCSFKCLYINANLFHEIYVDLKEWIVHWYWHLKVAMKEILLSFLNIACSLITYRRTNSNGLSINNNVANNWVWYWVFANFTMSGGLSSTSKESKGSALKSKLGAYVLRPKAKSTKSYMQSSTSMMSSPSIIRLSSNDISSCPSCKFW